MFAVTPSTIAPHSCLKIYHFLSSKIQPVLFGFNSSIYFWSNVPLCSSDCPGSHYGGKLLIDMTHWMIVDWAVLSLLKLTSKISYDYIKSHFLYYLVLYCMTLPILAHLNANWWKIECIIYSNWILYINQHEYSHTGIL